MAIGAHTFLKAELFWSFFTLFATHAQKLREEEFRSGVIENCCCNCSG